MNPIIIYQFIKIKVSFLFKIYKNYFPLLLFIISINSNNIFQYNITILRQYFIKKY